MKGKKLSLFYCTLQNKTGYCKKKISVALNFQNSQKEVVGELEHVKYKFLQFDAIWFGRLDGVTSRFICEGNGFFGHVVRQ